MSFSGVSSSACPFLPADFLSGSAVASKAYERACAPVCRRYHITQTSLNILLFLSNNPGYNTARDICTLRGIKSGITSVALDALMRAGFLVRVPDASDRRIQRLTLTDAAAPIVAEGTAVQRAFLRRLLAGVPPADFAALAGTMKKILENAAAMKDTSFSDIPGTPSGPAE